MLEDANLETTTETTADAPASQPVEGGDTPAVATGAESVSTQPGPGVNQQPQTIPKWRFDELNARMQAAEARLREGYQPPQQQQPQTPQAPKQEDFPTYEEYIRADARFVAQEEAKKTWSDLQEGQRRQTIQQTEQQRAYAAENNWTQKSQETAARKPDFEMKVATAPPLAPHALAVLKNSEAAGDLAYHLASDHALIQKINAMHPLDAIAEMGRIEGKLNGSNAGQPAQRKPSAGIPAIDPVGAGNKPGNIDPYALNTSVEDYVRATRPPPRRR